MLRRLQVLLLERRAESLVRALLRHGAGHCGGVEPCPQWDALCVMYDDASDRARAARA